MACIDRIRSAGVAGHTVTNWHHMEAPLDRETFPICGCGIQEPARGLKIACEEEGAPQMEDRVEKKELWHYFI